MTIDDNGIGMGATVRNNLFKPFIQSETATEMRVKGTGLGLAITANLMKRMHGEINIDSTEGFGTTVTITIPMKSVDGPKTLTSLADLKIIWLTETRLRSPRHFNKFFARSRSEFFYYPTDENSRTSSCQSQRARFLFFPLQMTRFWKRGKTYCAENVINQNLSCSAKAAATVLDQLSQTVTAYRFYLFSCLNFIKQ